MREANIMTRKTAIHHTEAFYSADERYRFDLQWRWRSGRLLVGWLLNPSIATEVVLDRSVSKIMVEANKLDLGGFRIINLFAFRSKDPGVVPPEPPTIREANEERTREVLAEAASEHWPVVAGWGEGGRHRQAWALSTAREAAVGLYRFGDLTSRHQSPRHPSRTSHRDELVRWDY